jgi:hypothetical protein
MSQSQALKRADNPELYRDINFIQTLLCAVVNPCMHDAELERHGLAGEPERRAARTMLEQELWQLIDQIPVPMPECFLELINNLTVDAPNV